MYLNKLLRNKICAPPPLCAGLSFVPTILPRKRKSYFHKFIKQNKSLLQQESISGLLLWPKGSCQKLRSFLFLFFVKSAAGAA